jgi:hypothetical protein
MLDRNTANQGAGFAQELTFLHCEPHTRRLDNATGRPLHDDTPSWQRLGVLSLGMLQADRSTFIVTGAF